MELTFHFTDNSQVVTTIDRKVADIVDYVLSIDGTVYKVTYTSDDWIEPFEFLERLESFYRSNVQKLEYSFDNMDTKRKLFDKVFLADQIFKGILEK